MGRLDRTRNMGIAKIRPSKMPRNRSFLSINYKKRGIGFRLFDLIRDVITPHMFLHVFLDVKTKLILSLGIEYHLVGDENWL